MIKKILFLTPFLFLTMGVWAQTAELKVCGLCSMCKDRIEEAALATEGVKEAAWEAATEKLVVKIDTANFDEDALHKKIAAVGHDTNKVKSKDEDYNDLPTCCRYRDIESGNVLVGTIFEKVKDAKKSPLIGATIYWLNHDDGTTSDEEGAFTIPLVEDADQLVISYIGFQNDTILIEKPGHVEIVMTQGLLLDEINVVRRKSSTSVSYINTIKTKQITSKELMKAACCNLSESFETNPSVDVSFTDAVTGTRTIEMLGLAGPNVQITRELLPDIRGLAALSGFTYIPGPWVEGMQLNLGAGSVLNGYESISGQINVEMKKPWSKERLHINGYVNNAGRYEANAIGNTRISDKWLSNLLTHYSLNTAGHDRNDDGFMDMPSGNLLTIGNIWKYEKGDGNEGMIGAKITNASQESGQDHHTFDHSSGNIWTAGTDAKRYELWFKRGKVFKNQPYKSIGFQFSSVYHDQKSTFGNTVYTGIQKSIYANLLYQTILGDTDHKITLGSSFVLDHFDETAFRNNYLRREYVPGIFGEYTQKFSEKLDMIVGLRLDHHNNYGLFLTPRLHLRYAVSPTNILRLAVGRGQRTASIFAENIGAFASSRVWTIQSSEESRNNPYGLNPEVAWNIGGSYSKNVEFDGVSLDVGLDYFYTNFQNQIVADYDQSPQQFLLYNLEGKSYSHSLQTQADFTFENGLDVRVAYRYVNVRNTYSGTLLEKPLVSPHRAFVNLAYHTNNGWSLDYTLNWQDTKRLPNTQSNPEAFRLGDRSAAFFLSNAQVTKKFGKRFDLYVGGENLFNFKQPNPILSSEQPFGQYFDSSMVWGPIFGRMLYAGFRYSIVDEE